MSQLAKVAKNIKNSLSFEDYESPDDAALKQKLGLPSAALTHPENLPEELTNELQAMLSTFADKEQATEQSLHRDLEKLKGLTAEVYSIGKQSVLLQGERISQARELLKSYGAGRAFVLWIDTVFRNRKTAYNFLSYYDFHRSLPSKLQERYLSMPLGPAYILASRAGEQKVKEEIVQSYEGQKAEQTKQLIHTKLPLAQSDKRQATPDLDRLIRSLESACDQITSSTVKPDSKQRQHLISMLEKTLDWTSR